MSKSITLDAGDRVEHRLGRRQSIDVRDRRFLARAVINLTTPPSRTFRYWYYAFNKDQTGPTCVANSAVHQLGNSPKPHWLEPVEGSRRTDITTAIAKAAGRTVDYMKTYRSAQSGQVGVRGYLYDRAQLLDEWSDTPPEGGTSYRAMAKVLQNHGVLGEYRWLTSMTEVLKAIIDYAPVTIGLAWRSEMFAPAGSLIHWQGANVGGHQIVLDGVNLTTKRVRIQTWGLHYWMPLADLQAILADGQTDACLPMESLI